MDLNYALLKLSTNGKKLIVKNLKLKGFNLVKEKRHDLKDKDAKRSIDRAMKS